MHRNNANDPLHTTNPDPTAPPTAPEVTPDLAPGSSVVDGSTAAYVQHKAASLGAEPERPLESVAVPGYEILGMLGRGGMGVVYKARHLVLKRTVALKMVLAGGHADARELARFRLEAEAVARLQHPNIVQIHEVGAADGHPYCALEFVEGGSLAGKIAGRPLPAPEAARLLEALARAVHLAHSRNVVHRDLKPANVLLAADGTPKITDFGLARQLDSDSGQTQAGTVIGTPSYMAPEQASGSSHEAGTPADVYALGAILYECLSGRPPFKGKTVVETLDQVRTQEPAPPSRWHPNVPPDLETICLKCLRKEPEKRYASAAELADDLGRYQRGEAIQARPAGRLERAVKWVKRNPVVTGAALAVVLALALGTTVSYLKYLDAEQQKGIAEERRKDAVKQTDIAEERRKDADRQKRIALEEAKRAKKARDFLVSIFELADANGIRGTMTARQILEDAEKRIPVVFAAEPKLRADLLKAIETVYAKITEKAPLAMLLQVRGTVRLQSARNPKQKAVPQALLYAGDRLNLAADAQVQLVSLSDQHKERLKPNRQVTIRRKGCEPAEAVQERDTSVPMTFVRLPKGTFYMGWDGQKKGVKTQIKEDFEIAVHDVTQGQWQRVMGHNPSMFSRFGQGWNAVKDIYDEELKLYPVENVSWDNAQRFITKLNEQEQGRGYRYRLPTEAEWEYACRGGATSEAECSFHFYLDKPTNDLTSERANIMDYPSMGLPKGRYGTTRVGAYPANKLGLCDMHGNVFQWCADLYLSGGEQPPKRRVIRGGCWGGASSFSRAGYSAGDMPYTALGNRGFRLVRVRAGAATGPRVPDPPRNPRQLASQGDWRVAATAYARDLAAQVLEDGEIGFEYAAVLLLSGDRPGYHKICAELLARSGRPRIRPYHVARACTLAPASGKSTALSGKQAQNELQRSGTEFWSLTEQGALAYRAARWDEAATLFEKSLQADRLPGRAVLNWLCLSLVEQRRSKPAAARAWLHKATQWFRQYPKGVPVAPDDSNGLHLHNWLEAQVLRREAVALLVLKK
jgi:formylglycine-generating enzyme required for sulfatase activity